ncbi:hypothetical protein XENOCAPTIV_020321, partial [Xenoophorus captivus]
SWDWCSHAFSTQHYFNDSSGGGWCIWTKPGQQITLPGSNHCSSKGQRIKSGLFKVAFTDVLL